MSFRARIALAAALAVAVAVVVASALAYVLVRDQLVSQLDSQLRERASHIFNRPLDLTNPFIVPEPPFGSARGYFQVVTADGRLLRPSNEPMALPVSDDVRATAQGQKGGTYYRDTSLAGTHMRVLVAPGTVGTSEGQAVSAALMVALPLTDVDSTLHRLGWILFFVALGGVGIAGILGYAVSRAALAPVRRLTRATEEITETRDLTRRVEAGSHDELGRLGTSFNTMLAALEDSQQAQRRLVADASHELRTPLTSLRTNVELLARGTLPDEERSKALADVSTQLEELTMLVTDVVDLARDGEPQRAVEDVRLDLLVGDAVDRARLHTPKVRFDADLHESLVQGVPDRLFRAVANVLDNAAKWSPPGGTIDVEVADCEVTVRDHGPGIAAEDLPHVFDRFYRSPAARATPGSGLGLAIVRQVVESHGGTVSAGTADGGGTVVKLAFPHQNGS
jgi:two-component system sensor histidine kinase MprB